MMRKRREREREGGGRGEERRGERGEVVAIVVGRSKCDLRRRRGERQRERGGVRIQTVSRKTFSCRP